MAEHTRPVKRQLSRRGFLIASGSIATGTGATVWAWPGTTPLNGQRINDFVAVAEDGAIEVICPSEDLGQGATTALPMILAEEIGADFDRVRVHPAPRDAARFGNPAFDRRMVTADSKATHGFFDVLRRAGAETRLALIAAAARLQGWRLADCRTERHAVRHTPDGAAIDFADIVRRTSLSRPSSVAEGDFKPRSDYALVGTSPAPRDLLAKVTGAFAYGIDRRSADALVAVVVRSPHLVGRPVTVDETATRSVDGVETLVRFDDGVAVVARHTFAALKGARLLRVKWTPPLSFDDTAQERDLTGALDGSEAEVRTIAQSGDPGAAVDAPIAVEMTFTTPQVSHLALEPLNAEARGTMLGLGVSIGGSSQSPDLDMRYAARTWKTAPFMVETVPSSSGGSFGRRVLNDAVRDAAAIAKIVGRPVQVIRPLADELKRGQVRPASVQRIVARADHAGRLLAWDHRIASDSVLARQIPSTFEARGRIDNTSTDGLRHPYKVATGEIIRWCRHESPPEPGFLRGVSAGTAVFAIETMIDATARKAGRDPFEWRLAHIESEEGREVLEKAAAMADWRAADGAYRGIAVMTFRHSWIATVATLAEDAGKIRSMRLDIAAHIGLAVHPGLVVRQIEGAAVFGLSLATIERLSYVGGAAAIEGVADYPILTADGMPAIRVELVGTETAVRPGGVGEIGVPTVAPAVGNALAARSGRYQTRLPLTLA